MPINLTCFQKPSRYIGNEINTIRKDAEIRVALAFPDIYDVGMSHLGLKILYKIINDLPYASAERVFHPWFDMEDEMRQKGILLSSLETKRLLKDFDIVGFSLQYELSYTTVLNMLYIGGIPLRSEARLEGNWPVVIAGGPCTSNPLPMSKFIDAFLIGDAEDAIIEILDTYKRWKKGGDGKRESVLKALSEIEGVYVPSLHATRCTLHAIRIKRRFIESLDSSPYPESPIVPYTSIVHDRINIEVSRGCTMGCRFCQAGIIYRPLRERSPENVLRIAGNSLKNTGHEEVSFTSLSAGDYSCLYPLLKEFNLRFKERKVSLSLPSLRVAAVNEDILKEIKSVRKTGFTIAPEAATVRLRNVINKDFTEDDYQNSLRALFKEGWLNLKLYFMVGLPTETDEDIEAIPHMVMQALKIAKTNTRRYVNISVTLSPFIPKPHTPFQWYGQENIDGLKRKLNYLRDVFYKKRLRFKGHDENTSLLEAVFSRGDERLSDLIETAWSSGCRLDAWGESFDFNKWIASMEKTGIDPSSYSQRTFVKDDLLPWEFIDTGIKKEFLYKEYCKALSAEMTTDCRKVCHACGLKCKETMQDKNMMQDTRYTIQDKKNHASCIVHHESCIMNHASNVRVRVEFSKTGSLRYLSHLELVTTIIRALRRADVPIMYSQGFHPTPKISFGPALGVGIAGIKEYFDMEILPGFDINYLTPKVNHVLPEGLRFNDIAVIPANVTSLSSFISRYEYEIRCADSSVVKKFIELKDENKEIDSEAQTVENILMIDKDAVRLILTDKEDRKVRLGDLLMKIFGLQREELDVTRLAMYGWKEGWFTPLDVYYLTG
jgi:radical SAM family uncharacterized protein/radical SAM-linked protein